MLSCRAAIKHILVINKEGVDNEYHTYCLQKEKYHELMVVGPWCV